MTSTSSIENNADNGNYDAAIVAIAIGADPDMDMGDNDDADVDHGIEMLVEDADIDHEETWLRQCFGDLPDETDAMDTSRFGNLPPGVQMKLVLDLRDREKATLVGSLRECSTTLNKLKEQLFDSEDKRMELEHELDTENGQIEELKQQFEEMKEAHQYRVDDIDRIRREMMIQSERLSRAIEKQKRQTQTQTQTSSINNNNNYPVAMLPPPSDSEAMLQQEESDHDGDNKNDFKAMSTRSITSNVNVDTICNSSITSAFLPLGGDRDHDHICNSSSSHSDDQQQQQDTYALTLTASNKTYIENEFERKLQTNPQYREEFERFQEFQVFYQQTMIKNKQGHHDNSGVHPASKLTALPAKGETFINMLEFQLGYERRFSSSTKTNI